MWDDICSGDERTLGRVRDDVTRVTNVNREGETVKESKFRRSSVHQHDHQWTISVRVILPSPPKKVVPSFYRGDSGESSSESPL